MFLFQIKRKTGKGVMALFLCYVTRTFKDNPLKKGGKKEGKEGGGKQGGRKRKTMKRIMTNTTANHKIIFCCKLINRIKSNYKMKLILVSVNNIKGNYQDFKLDFVDDFFLHYARKKLLFFKRTINISMHNENKQS